MREEIAKLQVYFELGAILDFINSPPTYCHFELNKNYTYFFTYLTLF